jgi:hypothetical protein
MPINIAHLSTELVLFHVHGVPARVLFCGVACSAILLNHTSVGFWLV